VRHDDPALVKMLRDAARRKCTCGFLAAVMWLATSASIRPRATIVGGEQFDSEMNAFIGSDTLEFITLANLEARSNSTGVL